MLPIVLGLLVKASTSWLVWKLPVMLTVALASVGESESASVKPLSTTTGVEVTVSASVKATVPPLVVTVGASLTAVTVTLAVSLAAEKAVLPPVALALTFVPCWPAVAPLWSQPR